jgi:hypothetical protein
MEAMLEASTAVIGSGSYQSSSKSTSAPCDAAIIFMCIFVSLLQALYRRNISSRVRFSSSSRRLFHAPVFTKISDSYLRMGRSSQFAGSPPPPSFVRKGQTPLLHSSIHQSNEGPMRLPMHHGLLPTLDQLRAMRLMQPQP